NLLHEVFPNEFPISISPVSVKIMNKGSEIISARLRRVKPTADELENLSNIINTLRKAGFDFDYGDGDTGIALVNGRRVPVFYEIFSFNQNKLEQFMRWKKVPEKTRIKILLITRKYTRDIIEKELISKSEDVRHYAVDALIKLGKPPVVKLLLKLIKRERSAYVMETIILGLGLLKVKSAIREIKKIIAGRNQHLKQVAINALGTLGEKNTAGFLADLTEDKNPEIKRIAFFSLERVLGEIEAQQFMQKRKAANKIDLETELLLKSFGVKL
ncbi:MAG: hypothetical protein Q7K42_06145, partial [Candidatus Diapherotrites archaeon]|nr:hypothetical protein [Candidatus Diapherotrites archaeon]